MNVSCSRTTLLLCFLLLSASVSAGTLDLSSWKFREAGTKKWLSAVVPGTVQEDLLRLKKIPDPFVENNEQKVQWVGTKNWEYQSSFSCPPAILNQPRIQLVFEGLDTYASVYLNDSLILIAENMFVRYTVDVTRSLKPENTLRILFHAPEAMAKKEAAKLKYVLPEGLRSFTRKAQYQYGWDWGPKILTCGIWKPVYLQYNGNVQPLSVRVAQTSSGLKASCKVYASVAAKATLQLRSAEGKVDLIHECTLQPGEQTIEVPFTQSSIRNWNPLHRGDQQLYTYTLSVIGDTSTVHCTTGFRTAELIQQRDSIGESFGFRINGKDIFARGANLIPPHIFLNKVTDAEYDTLVRRAAEANCNMLRVWGGGVYLPDIFYSLCDKYGIMVWQDFMFACSMIPGDKEFQQRVETEARQQIDRLSSHPCIVLWCGNNESDEGWHNWGWQKQFSYSPQDSALIWQHYQQVFQTLLPALVDSLGNGVAYVSSSPKYGWGRKESITSGDSHYWGVWWGMEPFEKYREKVPRFMSEYGFQSLPETGTWLNVVKKPGLTSANFRNHQKHPRGFETIDHSLKEYFNIPADFSDYTYLSQIQQSYGMKMAIDAHRSSYPYCRGTLFWQFNDCWPVVSWSAMDNRYHRKLFFYEAKHLFDSVYCSTADLQKGLVTSLHYDGTRPVKINLRTYFLFTNKPSQPMLIMEKDILLQPDTVIREAMLYPASQLKFMYPRETIIVTEAFEPVQGKVLNRNYLLRCKPNELKLDTANINFNEFSPGVLVFTSDVFTYGVYLYDESGEMQFEENGFNLVPGSPKMVRFWGEKQEKIRVKCLNNMH